MSEINNLKCLRLAQGLSQLDLALIIGVSQQAVGKWERGDSYPSFEKIPVLAKALKCEISQLFSEVEDEDDA